MSGPASSRRGFLRGLTTLPLIGGGVALIGAPTAVAEPASIAAIDAYSEWLFYERKLLCRERWPGVANAHGMVPQNTGSRDYHFPSGQDWDALSQPSTRAELVLAAVGCNWREGGHGC